MCASASFLKIGEYKNPLYHELFMYLDVYTLCELMFLLQTRGLLSISRECFLKNEERPSDLPTGTNAHKPN